MKIALEPVEANLLRCLSPRGNARKSDYLETTARDLLVSSMKREARLRRITLNQVGVIALTEAARRKTER
jgi:hypothetical protein